MSTAEIFTPQVVYVSDSAVAKVRSLVEEEGNFDLKLRVYVTGGGCSGFQYGFTFDEAVADDDSIVAIERVVESVEQIGLGEARNSQFVQGSDHGLLILREVGEDVGLHVVGDDRDPVILFERFGETVRGTQRGQTRKRKRRRVPSVASPSRRRRRST